MPTDFENMLPGSHLVLNFLKPMSAQISEKLEDW